MAYLYKDNLFYCRGLKGPSTIIYDATLLLKNQLGPIATGVYALRKIFYSRKRFARSERPYIC